jgi:hypothetical protein
MAGEAYCALIKCVVIETDNSFIPVITPTLTLTQKRDPDIDLEEDHDTLNGDFRRMIHYEYSIVYRTVTDQQCEILLRLLANLPRRPKRQRIQRADRGFRFHYVRQSVQPLANDSKKSSSGASIDRYIGSKSRRNGPTVNRTRVGRDSLWV